MIVVPVKEGENIERALKKFKRKFEKTGTVKELRARQQFDKPSVLKRLAKERAIYVQKLRRGLAFCEVPENAYLRLWKVRRSNVDPELH